MQGGRVHFTFLSIEPSLKTSEVPLSLMDLGTDRSHFPHPSRAV